MASQARQRPGRVPGEREEGLVIRFGGAEGVERLVRAFYRRMDTEPGAARIRAMHAADHEPMVRKLGGFLLGWLGDLDRGGRLQLSILPLAHQRFAIGARERDAWLACMRAALEDTGARADDADRVMAGLAELAELCRSDDG